MDRASDVSWAALSIVVLLRGLLNQMVQSIAASIVAKVRDLVSLAGIAASLGDVCDDMQEECGTVLLPMISGGNVGIGNCSHL